MVLFFLSLTSAIAFLGCDLVTKSKNYFLSYVTAFAVHHANTLIITKTCLCNILQFFTALKKDNFQMKNCDVFLSFAQNMDCGYTL